MKTFDSDNTVGALAEEQVRLLLGSNPPRPENLHHGDWLYGETYIEVKNDARFATTKNLCFELADLSGAVALTGVAKHATQGGQRLIIHRFGSKWAVYEAAPMLRGLIRRPRPGWCTAWANGSTRTFGMLCHPLAVDFIWCTDNTLRNQIDFWNFEVNPPMSPDEVIDLVRDLMVENGYEYPRAEFSVKG